LDVIRFFEKTIKRVSEEFKKNLAYYTHFNRYPNKLCLYFSFSSKFNTKGVNKVINFGRWNFFLKELTPFLAFRTLGNFDFFDHFYTPLDI